MIENLNIEQAVKLLEKPHMKLLIDWHIPKGAKDKHPPHLPPHMAYSWFARFFNPEVFGGRGAAYLESFPILYDGLDIVFPVLTAIEFVGVTTSSETNRICEFLTGLSIKEMIVGDAVPSDLIHGEMPEYLYVSDIWAWRDCIEVAI